MKSASRYYYKFGKYPGNRSVVWDIARAAASLDGKLQTIDLESLPISEYNKRYLGDLISTPEVIRLSLTKYTYVLAWALAYLDKPKQDIVFLDHGAGHGILSLLAREYGLGIVVHNDIYPVSCVDAELIGDALELAADFYIPGAIDDVLEFCGENNLECDSVANYDVIEHIYDINDFLQKVGLLSKGPMSLFLASTANERNPRIRKKITDMHKSFEIKDRSFRKGRKPTDATRAIADIRKEMIKEYTSSLTSEEMSRLTILTRGLIQKEILEQVESYILDGLEPAGCSHPTNTCDPFTGNWFEKLMNPDELVGELRKAGFESSIQCGFYDRPDNLKIRIAKLVLNSFIRLLGRQGLFFAPYFAISARK